MVCTPPLQPEINEMKTELSTIRQQHITGLVQTKKINQQLTKEREQKWPTSKRPQRPPGR